MRYRIVKDGLKFMISNQNQVYLEMSTQKLSEHTLSIYQEYVSGSYVRFIRNVDVGIQEQMRQLTEQSLLISQVPKKKPTMISLANIKQAMKELDQKSIIYTGAGISKAAGIMTNDELMQALCISEDYNRILESYIHEFDRICTRFKMFVLRLTTAQPTMTHKRIAEIVERTSCTLVTENLDKLHQKTGVIPINPFTDSEELVKLNPDRVILLGIGSPMCSQLFDIWYEKGATFYAVNQVEVEQNVPMKLYIGDVREIFEVNDGRKDI